MSHVSSVSHLVSLRSSGPWAPFPLAPWDGMLMGCISRGPSAQKQDSTNRDCDQPKGNTQRTLSQRSGREDSGKGMIEGSSAQALPSS